MQSRACTLETSHHASSCWDICNGSFLFDSLGSLFPPINEYLNTTSILNLPNSLVPSHLSLFISSRLVSSSSSHPLSSWHRSIAPAILHYAIQPCSTTMPKLSRALSLVLCFAETPRMLRSQQQTTDDSLLHMPTSPTKTHLLELCELTKAFLFLATFAAAILQHCSKSLTVRLTDPFSHTRLIGSRSTQREAR